MEKAGVWAGKRQVLWARSGRQVREGRGRDHCGVDGILHVLLPDACLLQKGRSARRLLVTMPGGVEYLTRIKTFAVSFLL